MIAEMTRVELVCLNAIRKQVVESLQAKGLLDLDEVPLEFEAAPDFLERVELEGEAQEQYAALEEADRNLAETLPLLTIAPGNFDTEAAVKAAANMSDTELRDKVNGWAEQIREVTRERANAQDQIEVLKNYKGILEQVAPALGGQSVKLGKGARAVVLRGNVKKVVARLEERLGDEIGSDATFHKNQTSRNEVVGLISFPEAKEDEVSRILGQEGVTTVDMREQGFEDATIADVLERIDKTIAHNEGDLVRLEGLGNKISREIGASMVGAKAVVTDRLAQFRAQAQFAQSKMVTVIQGWTPSDKFDELDRTVEAEFPGQVEVNKVGFDSHEVSVPTQLRNHPLIQPFEQVMRLFNPPSYGTIDPTWMVGVSFVVFYGFILGDAAYGAIIVLLSMWIKSKWGQYEIGNAIGSIAMYMGVSSIFFGVLYGEYFGNFVELWLWPEVFGREFHWYLFHRAHETTQLLVFAIWFGILLIPGALILGVKEDWKHGHPKHALEKAGMLLGLLAVIIFVFNYFEYLFFSPQFFVYLAGLLGAVGVVLIFYAMGALGLVGVIEIMSLGGNVLSYARLMALGIASIALADIANILPGMMGYLIGIPMALLVHCLNIVIGIASPTIHSLRLNFVEFLPKFYSPEGRGYNPFRKEAQW